MIDVLAFARLVGVTREAVAERRLGEILLTMPKAKGAAVAHGQRGTRAEPRCEPATLAEIGVDKKQASLSLPPPVDGRGGASMLDLAAERAALARAQRERIEMQNAVTRGELAPVAALEQVLAAAGSRIAAIFDAIPGALRRRSSLSSADIDFVAGELAKARNTVAGLRLADLDDDTPEHGR